MTYKDYRSLASKGYASVSQKLAWASYYFLYILRDLGEDSAIIVYQMGKVGSTTVTETLKNLSLSMPIYQVHHLTEEGQQIEEYKASLKERPAIRRRAYWAGRYLRRRLASEVKNNQNWFLVTLTRDPIARNISGFFHSLRRYHPQLYKQLETNEFRALFPRLKETFLQDYPHDRSLQWFDAELSSAFDIDLYQQRFPWTKGYDIIQHRNVRLLILRLEDLQSCMHIAFEDWLGRSFDTFELVSANRAAEKPYPRHYKEFKDWLVLPAEYLDHMYGSKFAQHFYSPSELERFWQKWRGSAGAISLQ